MCQLIDEVPRCVHLAKRKLVMILVIQDVEEVGVKRVDVLYLGELIEDACQGLIPVGGRELNLWPDADMVSMIIIRNFMKASLWLYTKAHADLAHVELTDALNAPTIADHSGGA